MPPPAGKSSEAYKKSRSFWERIEPFQHIEELFSFIPDVHYFSKDREGRFMFVDEGFVQMLGCREREEVIGKTDFDFFSRDVAQKYVADDRRVMDSGVAIRNLAESIPGNDKTFTWRVVYKVPVRDRSARVVGIAGVVMPMTKHNAPTPYAGVMLPVLDFISEHYGRDLSVKELAKVAGMSLRSFERNFRHAFQRTPMQHLTSVRLQAVRRALVGTENSLSMIATECGFYDQSHMTQRFRSHFGKTPRAYRLLHR